MNQYKHLIAFDLTSYGAALALLNQFADGDNIKDFEISPCGTTAQLILLAKEPISLEVIKSQALSMIKSQILDVQIVRDIHADLLPSYLSQNKVALQKSLFVLEGSALPTAFVLMQKLLNSGYKTVDFRIVRTGVKNVILTLTQDDASDFLSIDSMSFKKTFIEKIEASLKNIFQN